MKVKRVCAGEYKAIEQRRNGPDLIVRICKVYYPNDGIYWVADPDWEPNTSDPLPTKRDAIEIAKLMFLEAV